MPRLAYAKQEPGNTIICAVNLPKQVEAEFDLIEHREALAPLLAELPERERYILLLRFFGGMTQTEVAQQVGISQMHVSRLLTRTLSRLRRKLTVDAAVPVSS